MMTSAFQTHAAGPPMAYVYETSEQLQQLKHNSRVSKRISKEILSQSSGGPRRS